MPNGGKRNPAEAARFKAMGVKAGVPDLCLPVPMNGYAGLYIEMKYSNNKTDGSAERMDQEPKGIRLQSDGMLWRHRSNSRTGSVLAGQQNNSDRSNE